MRKIRLSILFICCHSFLFAQAWKELGPIDFPVNSSGQINGIGRVTQMVFHPTLANKRYATSASGGLYYTQDTGHHWIRLGTDVLPVTNLASICVDHTNDQILYLGTGDPNYYGSDLGVYKSVNGGMTWVPANTGIGNLMAVDLIMHPNNNQIIIAATNNGIWRTTDGAGTWASVSSGGEFTHMQHVPGTSTLIAVTSNQVRRSTDWGLTWIIINNIIFGAGGSDGMRVMVNNVAPNIVYIASNGNNGEIYKSTDGGVSFASIYSSTTQCLVCYDEDPTNAGQGNYNFAACSKPNDPNTLYVAAQCLWRSTDGGLNWQRMTEWSKKLHTDHHQFIFDPYIPDKFWSINDGGIFLRIGINDSLWTPMSDGISATEIYRAASSSVNKRLISIGTQDNGEKFMDAQGWFTNRGGDWTSVMLFDYSVTNYVYYMSNGKRRGFGFNTGEVTYNSPFTATNNARIALTKNNPNTGLLAKDTIWRSTDLNASSPTWTPIMNNTWQIRDLVFSSADSTTAYVTHNGKVSRIENIYLAPNVTTVNTPFSNGTRGSVATVRNNINIVYLSCNARMYRSTDKGATWNNITYNLPGTNILKVYHDDYSSNERVYVCSGNSIYTKTLSDTVWQNITGNLPTISNIREFMMINDSTVASKLRVSYYGRGTWEYKLNPQFPPVADFKANSTYICVGDTVELQDLSYDDSLTYNWSIPGGTPSSSNLKNPKVTYNTSGNYSVTLTVTNPYGQNVKIANNYITVMNNASMVDTFDTGKAVYLDGSSASYINVGKLNLNSNNVTLMCWIKPDGPQNDWGGLLFVRGNGTTSGLSIKDDNEIRIHWDDNYWGSATNLFANTNEWNHCALVVTPTEARVYVNGEEAIISGTFPVQALDKDMMLGADVTSGSRRFKGWMDEAIVYNKALSKDEIRDQMHLIKYPILVTDSMKGYWQLNNATSANTTPNSVDCRNQGVLNVFTPLVKSTAPFGIGTSQRITVNSGGNINVSYANLQCGFPSTGVFPDGEIVVSRLRTNPDEMPSGATDYPNRYWIIDNYGAQQIFSELDSIIFEKAGKILGTANEYQLYTRAVNADGNTWGTAIANATEVVNGDDGSIAYKSFIIPISNAGQFVSKGPYFPLSVQVLENSKQAFLYPNPSAGIFKLHLDGHEKAMVSIHSSFGNKVIVQEMKHGEEVNVSQLATGGYLYEIELKHKAYSGMIQVVR